MFSYTVCIAHGKIVKSLRFDKKTAKLLTEHARYSGGSKFTTHSLAQGQSARVTEKACVSCVSIDATIREDREREGRRVVVMASKIQRLVTQAKATFGKLGVEPAFSQEMLKLKEVVRRRTDQESSVLVRRVQ